MGKTQHAMLCLSTDRASSVEIDRELQIAGAAGFSCIELWVPTLETYLASHPVVWLDMQMRQHGIHRLIVDGLVPLSIVRNTQDEDALVSQARFLELCTHLDTLGGAILVLHPATEQRERSEGEPETSLRVLRTYADLAAAFEIDLGFEFRADSTVPTLEAAQALVKDAARSNLHLSLSAREWCASKVESRVLNNLESSQIALVHLDSQLFPNRPRCQPSQATLTDRGPSEAGASPTDDEPALTLALCTHLAAAGFRGPYCIPISSGTGAPLDRARAAHRAATEYVAPLYAERQSPLA